LTLAILMPHLSDFLLFLLGCNLGLIIHAFWVVSRPCLKSIGGAPPLLSVSIIMSVREKL
jgi:hypothetical protein